jgi:hypothetical protein
MQLVVRNWANFQLHVSHATGNQLHKTVAKCQISSSGGAIIVALELGDLHQLRQSLEFLFGEEKATNSHLKKKHKRPLGPKPSQYGEVLGR